MPFVHLGVASCIERRYICRHVAPELGGTLCLSLSNLAAPSALAPSVRPSCRSVASSFYGARTESSVGSAPRRGLELVTLVFFGECRYHGIDLRSETAMIRHPSPAQISVCITKESIVRGWFCGPAERSGVSVGREKTRRKKRSALAVFLAGFWPYFGAQKKRLRPPTHHEGHDRPLSKDGGHGCCILLPARGREEGWHIMCSTGSVNHFFSLSLSI